mmetsp:Transcript_4959/g.6412  ORF Transcript_4959/g.6412 Transcript_4959/m.6412 type:complete len:211 (-) Transcript_4959:209-841(-)
MKREFEDFPENSELRRYRSYETEYAQTCTCHYFGASFEKCPCCKRKNQDDTEWRITPFSVAQINGSSTSSTNKIDQTINQQNISSFQSQQSLVNEPSHCSDHEFEPFRNIPQISSMKRDRSWDYADHELNCEVGMIDSEYGFNNKRAHSSDIPESQIRLPDTPTCNISFPTPLPEESNSNIDYSTSNNSLKQLHLARISRQIASCSHVEG